MTKGNVAEGVLPPLLSTIEKSSRNFRGKLPSAFAIAETCSTCFQSLFPFRMLTTFSFHKPGNEKLHKVLPIDDGYYEQDPQSSCHNLPIP